MPNDLFQGRIVILGFGNMGKALARGLQYAHRNSGVTHPLRIIACDRFPEIELDSLPAGLSLDGIKYISSTALEGQTEDLALTDADTLIVATKPQNLLDAADKWWPLFAARKGNPLIISILAGVPTSIIHEQFAADCPVVRAMPNIAATVDAAATALAPSPSTSQAHAERAKTVFDSVGRSWIVPEDLLNAVTGLSGSGPAYIYMVIEALSDGGVKMGMPRKLSLELAAQTVLGAAKLVIETKEHPAVLRDQVTTPGGTTISAIHELERHGLRPMLISAVVTATKRSQTLAKIVRQKLARKG